MSKAITFLSKEYTHESLSAMGMPELLELRNLIASNLGVATIRSFKDQEVAVEGTWKALEKFEKISAEGETGEAPPKKEPKAPKQPKDRKPAKSSAPGIVKRPSRKMFSTITKTGEHNGTTHGRAHRWPNYRDGMTLTEVVEGDGTETWDVYNWADKGIMTVTEPTDEEYAARKAAWYESHNLIDPDALKDQKIKERAEAKEKRLAEAAAKKEAREAKAAEAKAKAEEKAAAKAAAETPKAEA